MEAGTSDFRHSKPYTGLTVGRRLGHESVKLEGLAARSRFAWQTQRQLEQAQSSAYKFQIPVRGKSPGSHSSHDNCGDHKRSPPPLLLLPQHLAYHLHLDFEFRSPVPCLCPICAHSVCFPLCNPLQPQRPSCQS